MDRARIDLEAARQHPGAVFARPRDVLERTDLSPAEKVELLRRWEFDARGLAVAEEENMPGDEPNLLDEVGEALARVTAGRAHDHSAPTKQGGE